MIRSLAQLLPQKLTRVFLVVLLGAAPQSVLAQTRTWPPLRLSVALPQTPQKPWRRCQWV